MLERHPHPHNGRQPSSPDSIVPARRRFLPRFNPADRVPPYYTVLPPDATVISWRGRSAAELTHLCPATYHQVRRTGRHPRGAGARVLRQGGSPALLGV